MGHCKHWIRVYLACLAGLTVGAPAAAQSSVTLYGLVDTSVQWNQQYESSSLAQESVWGVASGYQSGSRWGVRGSEAIGPGLTASFVLEGGFDSTTGSSDQGGLLFGRQAWVGLGGNWGGLYLGRIATPSSTTGSFDLFAAADPFAGGFGLNTIGSTFVAANSLRVDNAVFYVSPDWSGFKLAGGYSFDSSGQETAPQGTNTTVTDLSASFARGGFYAVATYDLIGYPDAGSGATNAGNPDQKLFQLGLSYDFKVVQLYGAWASQANISATRSGVSVAPPTGLAAYDNNAFMIGLSAPLFSGSLMLSYQWADADSYTVGSGSSAKIFEPDYSVWGVAYAYPLSKRTNVYVGYGQADAGGSLISTSFDRNQFALGMRHRF